jgi:hypothetical protein
VNNDAVLRLREPGAWLLLGSAALYLVGGLIELLFNSDVPFTFRAFNLVNGDQFFAGVTVVAVIVVAVLLATRWGGGPTPQARNIALIGVIILAAVGIIDALSTLVGLAAGSNSGGIVLDVSIAAKVAMFLYGVAKLAIVAVGGYYVFSVFQSFAPVSPSTGPFPQQGYPQQQPPYGYPQQQPYGGAPYGQQQAQPPYPPPQPQGHYQQQPPPPPPAQPYQQAQPSDGEWTVAYGSGEQEPSKGEAPSDPYRPPQ